MQNVCMHLFRKLSITHQYNKIIIPSDKFQSEVECYVCFMGRHTYLYDVPLCTPSCYYICD